MIINLRGTSGSGKTHLARRLLSLHPVVKPHFKQRDIDYTTIKGDKRTYSARRANPLYYVGERGNLTSTAFLGHYETPCGGCDTLPDYDCAFHLARELHGLGHDVVMEGLLLSEERHRSVRLGADLRVVYVDTPLETCLESVNERRRARNPHAGNVDPGNTTRRVGVIERSLGVLESHGVEVFRGDRGEAFNWCVRKLGLQSPS